MTEQRIEESAIGQWASRRTGPSSYTWKSHIIQTVVQDRATMKCGREMKYNLRGHQLTIQRGFPTFPCWTCQHSKKGSPKR